MVNSVVTLNGGASACDLFWTATSATTLAADTTFAGTVIDDAGITVGANSIWTGRALAFGGTVTTDSTTITVPTCAVLPPPPATLRVIKLVVNTSGGTAVPADFNLHVKELGVDVLGSPAVGIGAPGTSYSLTAGTYVVSEDVNSSYTQSFTGDCNLSGSISLLAGDSKVCTIVNTDIAIPVPPSAPSGISGIPGNLLPQPGSGGGGGGRYSARVIPLIGLSKVPSPLVLPVGSGFVNYNYSVWNVGGAQTLTDINLTDDKCSSISLVSGDLNDNNKLDSDENWKYVCGINLTETTTNTAIVTGYSDDSYRDVAVATAIATVVVGQSVTPPLIDIVKVPSRLVPFPFGGGEVIYSYTVTNPGVTPISNVVVSDDKCSPLSLAKGDNNNNRLLDTDEVWSYLCKTNISVSTMNIATAEGVANGFIAIDYAFATVLVSSPGFPNSGFGMKWDTIIMLVLILLVPSTVLLVLRKTKLKRI